MTEPTQRPKIAKSPPSAKRKCSQCDRPARKGQDTCSDACEMDARVDEGLMHEIFDLGYGDD